MQAAQPTISSFFKPKKRPISPIDLTEDDSSVQHVSKKSKHFEEAQDSHPGLLEQWSFASSQSANMESLENEKRKRERHELFKNKLLQADISPSQRNPSLDYTYLLPDDEEGEESREQDIPSHRQRAAHPMRAKKRKIQEIGPSGEPYTPLELQVLKLKREHQGTLLMVEVGYKYRFYGDDAKVASKELGMVAYTDRNFLVASIPTHRRDVHLKKLLSQGHRVGIVGQVETAALKKAGDNRNAPFERKLLHLYTAATYVEALGSSDDTERFMPPLLMCLIEEQTHKGPNDVRIGIITVCPSTGDVVWDDFEDTPMRIELDTRLAHTRPAELLRPSESLTGPTNKLLSHFASSLITETRVRIEIIPEVMPYDEAFDFVSDFYVSRQHSAKASADFASGKLLAAAVDFPKRVTIALAHVIQHLATFGISDVLLETKFFDRFSSRIHMLLGANTLSNLEVYRNETDHMVKGSLLWVLDNTKTKFGARMLKQWIGRPLTDKRVLQGRGEAVEEILESSSEHLHVLRETLKELPDLAKGLCRIQYGQCTPQELAVLLPAFNKIANAFGPTSHPSDVGLKSQILNNIIFSLPKIKEPIKEMLSAISLEKAAEGQKEKLWRDSQQYPAIIEMELAVQRIEAGLREELAKVRRLLRMPSLQWITVAGDEYLIELDRNKKRPIPDTWVCHSKTRHRERYRTLEVISKMEERSRYQEMLQAEASKAYQSFLQEMSCKYYAPLRDAVMHLATADCIISFAHVALRNNYVRPQFTDNDDMLEIVDGRHPMIEELRSDPFVPNSVKMGDDMARSKIITGPNMGGKSSSVRMVALIAIMAQIGSYVPAGVVRMSLLDSILTRMGASDDLAKGRSTFMVEMSETRDILCTATSKSLVILDELGRGTSTFDGMAIADAVLHQLVQSTKSKTLFITHYPLVAASLEHRFPHDVENLHMDFEARSRIDGTREVTFLYRLARGLVSDSFGIECGRLAGLPESVLSMAADRAASMKSEVQQRLRQNT
ncbi:hypothetical protein AX15_004907 [Amanita polypyramis BW_CC]|nr:hypothetical protein AX15_004907 [Amanita polypyramis BW_CC]